MDQAIADVTRNSVSSTSAQEYRRFGPEQKVPEKGQHQDMESNLAERIEHADDDVERDPGKCKPACPIASTKRIHSRDDGENADQTDAQHVPREVISVRNSRA